MDTNDVIKSLVGSVVRHAVTAAGAVLIAKGFATDDEIGALANVGGNIAVGVALYGLGQVLSWAQKLKQAKK